MRFLSVPILGAILCAVLSVSVLADGTQRAYSVGGGNAVVLALFVALCTATLAVLVIGYQVKKRRRRKRKNQRA